ncbi:hypothetical protein D3C72_1928360 [compost metagenome]
MRLAISVPRRTRWLSLRWATARAKPDSRSMYRVNPRSLAWARKASLMDALKANP